MKILFLAANPVDVVSRLRIDEEIREVSQKIRLGTHRDHLELVPELAVRAGDLQAALLRHQPEIVHFSGHCHHSGGIMLEVENGNRRVVNREALTKLFRILKGNIRCENGTSRDSEEVSAPVLLDGLCSYRRSRRR